MTSLNKAILIGRLGKDPETRYVASGDAICNFSLATSESWKDKSGEKKDKVEWHSISAFGKLAEICGKYLKKGSLVYIEGKIQTRKWKDKDGQDRYTTEIRADQMKMLGGQDNSTKQESSKPASSGFEDMSDDIPFLFNMNTVCDTLGKPLSYWRGRYGKEMSLVRANKTDF